MTSRQIADYLRLSLQTIRRYIKSGKIKAYKAKKKRDKQDHWVIDKEDFKSFVDSFLKV